MKSPGYKKKPSAPIGNRRLYMQQINVDSGSLAFLDLFRQNRHEFK
jgi:hypothetical protein